MFRAARFRANAEPSSYRPNSVRPKSWDKSCSSSTQRLALAVLSGLGSETLQRIDVPVEIVDGLGKPFVAPSESPFGW